MKENAFNHLDNVSIYDNQKLNAILSPVGSELAALIDKNGQKEKLSTPKVFNTPDGVEVEFYRRTQLTVTSHVYGFTYQLSHLVDHELVVFTKFNIKNEPICTLLLPTKSKLKYESPKKIKTIFFDYLNDRLYAPLKQPSDPNIINNFYQKTRSLLNELSQSI